MFKIVAVSDLFPLADQCPGQGIRPLTDQAEAERIDSLNYFSTPFWKSRLVREHLVSSQDRPVSRSLLRTFHMEKPSRNNALQLASHTEEPALRHSHKLLVTGTHTSYKLKDQHANRRHQK